MKNGEITTAPKGGERRWMAKSLRMKSKNTLWVLLCATCFALHSSLFISCSETDDVEADDFANWQTRNDAFFASLEDSLTMSPEASQWEKIKAYTLNDDFVSPATDYIYVKKLETSNSIYSPLYTDTVLVAYQGRIMPSAAFPEGRVFEQTFVGTFSWRTTSAASGVASSFVMGFTTALLHMHRGDRWRVYIPYQLGYNATAKTNIPAYSTLIFDLALVDLWHPVNK